MSYELIKEGLKKVTEITTWDSLLIKCKHNTHPNEFTCYKMNFSTDTLLKETLNDMCNAFLRTVENFDKKVELYTGFNSKNVVDKLPINNPLLNDCWSSLIQHINCSDDTTALSKINANAFVFVGTYNDETNTPINLYLLARKNPILSFKKGRSHIFISQHNTISKTSDPLVQFGKCFDAIVYKNTIYMINSNCESIFNMEYSHKIICQKSLASLEDAKIVSDISHFRQYANFGQNPKKFITYDESIVIKLKEPKWKNKIVRELKIPFNSTTKKFDLSDENHAKIFTLLICGKTKLNMFDDGICEVPSSTPLNLS